MAKTANFGCFPKATVKHNYKKLPDLGVNVRVRICKERWSNEHLLPVIFFSATQDFKKEHPRKKLLFEKLTERANFLLLQRLLYEKMVKNR